MSILLGRPWKPYQQLIGEVAGEHDPETGRYDYHTVVVWLPRQTGKTTAAYDSALGRGRLYPGFRSRYTTHQGTITTAKFADWFREIEAHPATARRVKTRRSQGTEAVSWHRGGSYFQAFPPRDGALRSQSLDLVVVDEAQEQDEPTGEALKRTITPTFSTRRRHQLWIVLTAGTDSSTYARGYVDKALAGMPGYAIFDYGCPDDVDPLDEDLWETWHPGLAYGLTTRDALRQGLDDGVAVFVREYANQWTRTTIRVVDPADLAATLLPSDANRPEGRLCLGVDVASDRGSAAISIAVDQPGGPAYLELVDAHAGTEWVVGRLLELQATHGAPIAIDPFGAVGTVADALTLAKADLLTMKLQDTANAAAGLLDVIGRRDLELYPGAAVSEGFDGLALKPLRDGNGFLFSRLRSAAPVAPLVALAAALWGLARLPEPLRPEVSAH